MHRITKLPTFVFYKNKQQQKQLEFSQGHKKPYSRGKLSFYTTLESSGANIPKLEDIVVKNAGSQSFGGEGNRLGGSSAPQTFSGQGNRLGGAPPVATSTTPQTGPPQTVQSEVVHVDLDKPTTKIQFRMADGR